MQESGPGYGPMVNKVDEHIGRQLRQLRLERGHTVRQLAQDLSTREIRLACYENGKTRVAASQLFLIAQFYGVPPSYFFDGLI